jgi:hypothetical protein
MENPRTNEMSPNSSLYYLGLISGLVALLLTETFLEVPDVLLYGIELLSFAALLIQLLSVFGELSPWSKIVCLLVFVVSIIIGYNTESLFFMFFFFASVYGAKGLAYPDILKAYFRTSFIFCISILTLCYFGFVKNKIDYAIGREMLAGAAERNSFGYAWPTDLASHIFFILLTFWIVKKGRLSVINILSFLCVTYWLLIYTDARLGCGCILLLLLFSVYLYFQSRIPSLLNVLFGTWTVLWIPLLLFGSLWSTINYDSSSIIWMGIDVLLSGRLGIGQEMLDYKGVTFFGQTVEMNGGDVSAGEYSYIDSSFLQSMIIYGIVFSALLIIAYMCVSYKAYKRKDYVFLCAVIISGISGFVAQHFLQIFMNPLLIALFAEHIIKDNSDIGQMEEMELKASESGDLTIEHPTEV